jgi:sulfur-oxidizing protein SoxY
MAFSDPVRRRSFVQAMVIGGMALASEGAIGLSRRLLGAAPVRHAIPEDPEVPNEIVAKILRDHFGDRPIQHAHVSLDMPQVAEDGRAVPVIIESDLPMTAEKYVKGVYLIVDHNPDPLVTAFHLTPSVGKIAIETRIKMKRTSWIRAILETNTGEVWADYAKVETSLNGCG